MADIKYIKDPINFLRETGLLFELNRQILHPFGLALAVTPPEKGNDSNTGEIMIWDCRDEDEGVVYATDTYISGVEKLNEFLESFGLDKLVARKESLGYTVQNYPDPHVMKNGVVLATYNPNYDEMDEQSPDSINFKVPFGWLDKQVNDWYGVTVSDFIDSYTYDTAAPIYKAAMEEQVILHQETYKNNI